MGGGSGKLGREAPPVKEPFSHSQGDLSMFSHTHTLCTSLFSPGDRSNFLFHTHRQANINTPTLCLICARFTRATVEANDPDSF